MSIRKKIAVIGGGASGIISGYLLSENHEVTLYEKQPILGGNVRTLNKNVLDTTLPKNLNIENGVLGFSQNYYPKFHQLLQHLGTPLLSYKPSISLFQNNHFYPAKTTSYFNRQSLSDLLFQPDFRAALRHLVRSKKEFKTALNQLNPIGKSFSDYESLNGLYKDYLQALFMLSFSTPFEKVPHLPQSLVNPYLDSLPNSTWSFVKGGVYSYMETILQKSNMKVICNAKNLKITRNENAIILNHLGENIHFDAVIIATTPGSIKELLTDMDHFEQELFADMNDQNFQTIAHTDTSIYGKFKKVSKTPMDLFLNNKLSIKGYNTYQNDVYQLNKKTAYSFAYNLNDNIAPKKILHQANHIVPLYSKLHDKKVEIIKSINGQKHTYFAGAYLSNGLHEGAVASAIEVALKLGGKNIFY